MVSHQSGLTYSIQEERANWITHGLAALLSIAGLVFLTVNASKYGTAYHIVSSAIFGSTLIILYSASTLYHVISVTRVKMIFRQIDHAMIYLLIAGTYTPFTLVNLKGPWGWSLFGTVWGLALLGILLELVLSKRIRVLSISLYLTMGWLVIIAAKPLIDNLAVGGLLLLVMGGLFYSLGILFYIWKSLRYHHAIWHLFVITGSLCHFFAVFLYVIPPKT